MEQEQIPRMKGLQTGVQKTQQTDSVWSQESDPPEDGVGKEWGLGPLRPVDGPDACHTVLEAMSPEAGHVVIHYLHLTATKRRILKQMKLVIWTILGARLWHEPAAPVPRTGVGEAPGTGINQDPAK